jgi:hypothetical protein
MAGFELSTEGYDLSTPASSAKRAAAPVVVAPSAEEHREVADDQLMRMSRPFNVGMPERGLEIPFRSAAGVPSGQQSRTQSARGLAGMSVSRAAGGSMSVRCLAR